MQASYSCSFLMQRILKGLRKKFDYIWLYNSSTALDELKTTHRHSAKQKTKTSEQSNHVHSRFDIVPRRLIQIVHLTVWVTPNNSSSHFWANKFCCILGRVPHHLGSNMSALPKKRLSISEDPFCGCVLFFGFVDMMLKGQSTNCKQLIHTFDGFLNSQPPHLHVMESAYRTRWQNKNTEWKSLVWKTKTLIFSTAWKAHEQKLQVRMTKRQNSSVEEQPSTRKKPSKRPGSFSKCHQQVANLLVASVFNLGPRTFHFQ